MAFYRDCSLARVPLPTYPFQRERYWLEREPDQAVRQTAPPASSNGNGAHPSSVAPPTSATPQSNGSRRMPRGVAPLRPTDRPLAVHAHVAYANPDHLQKVFEDCLIRVLELPDGRRIPPDQDLLDLGMDSITALEMLFAVEKSLGRPLRMPGIAKSRTINQFIALMESCASPERAAPSVS
jgi:acyl carrier protein